LNIQIAKVGSNVNVELIRSVDLIFPRIFQVAGKSNITKTSCYFKKDSSMMTTKFKVMPIFFTVLIGPDNFFF